MRSQIISALALSTMLIAQAGAGLAHMLMERGSTLSQGIDFDGDNYATWRDVTIALHQHLDRTGRLDSLRAIDGSLSHNPSLQIYLDIRAIFCASMGDANGDGVIDAQDLAIIADAIASNQYLLAADTNLDGAVTPADLQHAIGQANRFAGAPIDFADHSIDDIACHLMYMTRSLFHLSEEESGMLIATGTPLPLTPDGVIAMGHSDAGWPLGINNARCNPTPALGHIFAISRDYPSDHLPSVSGYPANHIWEISSRSQWPNPHPEYWPANHFGFHSKQWSPSSHIAGVSHYEHQQAASSIWKPGHGVAASISWSQPPGVHSHLQRNSRIWPANHYREMSTEGEWPYEEPVHAHFIDISRFWESVNHSQGVSNSWPPSHMPQISGDRFGHLGWISLTWPANHSSSTSSLWPTKTYPREWPPNHNSQTSTEQLGVPPALPEPPGIFPPGHHWWTTMMDFRQLVPLFGVYEDEDDE